MSLRNKISNRDTDPVRVDILHRPHIRNMNSSHPIYYSALYINSPEELLKLFPPKHKNVYGHHSTIAFKPKSSDGLEVGRKVSIKILGRATDEKGDALLVENTKSTNKFPHITLSSAEEVPPEYSNVLLENAHLNGSIQMFNEPSFIDATEGYELEDRKVIID